MSKSILTSTLYVTLLTFLIKFLGLVKQSVLAAFCGATDDTDAFFIASGVLLQLCTMIFSAISISLLTVHTQTLVNKGREMSNDLINAVLRYFLPISVLITLIFLIGAPYVARFLAPLYSESQIENLAHYIRLMRCVFVLWCYYLTINVILETDKEFIPGRGQGFFQNIFLIIAAIFLFQSYGMESLIWSFILSGLAECVLVTWCARKRFRVIFKECVNGLDFAQNLVVVKTMPGLGAAAGANIDALKMPAVLGTLSGDDTTLVIMRDTASAERFCNEIRKMLE